MPPPKKPAKNTPDPEQVLRMPEDEQISWLVHQHELLADWQLGVDERLNKQEEVTRRMDERMATIATNQLETKDISQKILLFLQGQRDSGFERPGLVDDVKANAAKYDDLDKRLSALETLRARFGWGVVGATVVIGYYSWSIWDKLSALASFLTPH